MDLLHWRSLTEAIRNIQVPGRLILDLIWNKRPQRKFATKNVDVDIISGDKLLAPFVTQYQAGKVVNKIGRSIRSFESPQIRIKTKLNAGDFNVRGAGATIYPNPADRDRAKNELIAIEQQNLKDKIARRKHWMACQALTGKIAYSGADDVNFEIDFLFDNTHKPVLTDSAVFSHADANPPAKFKEFARLVTEDSGFPAGLCIFGTSAADAFLAHAKTISALNALNVNRGKVDTTKDNRYLGNFDGVEMYEMAEKYVDEAGAVQSMIDPKSMIMIAPEARFDDCYGAVEDQKAGGNIVTDIFSKMWEEEDPSALWLLAESHPLPCVNQPGAVVYAKVLA
jgi:hypothetical protein